MSSSLPVRSWKPRTKEFIKLCIYIHSRVQYIECSSLVTEAVLLEQGPQSIFERKVNAKYTKASISQALKSNDLFRIEEAFGFARGFQAASAFLVRFLVAIPL